ncbi:MAG: tetratricopeptide repeat protein [Nitrospirae bacterium]|nr:tetratricopeptide repeat protein [Nitrospirota bacterium]
MKKSLHFQVGCSLMLCCLSVWGCSLSTNQTTPVSPLQNPNLSTNKIHSAKGSSSHNGPSLTRTFTDEAIMHGFSDALQSTALLALQFDTRVSTLPDLPEKTFASSISFSSEHTHVVSGLDADWHTQVGWTLVLDGNYSGAEAAYREALRQNHLYAGAHLGLGIALIMQGNRKESISSYEKALEIRPNYPAALVHLGYAYTDGFVGTPDFMKAKTLFQLASQQGDPFAMLALVDLKTRQAEKE